MEVAGGHVAAAAPNDACMGGYMSELTVYT